MSHDIKKFKILKKIIGLFGFKLVDKLALQSERIIEHHSIGADDFIKSLIKDKKIKNIIQVGANDGESDDFLKSSINDETNLILLEPIKNAFLRLKENYKNFKNAKLINAAVDVNNQEKVIYTINTNFFEYYKKKYKTNDVKWLDVLSSFNKNHLIKHGIKKGHIVSYATSCITFNELISQNSFENLDLLILDVEGYDSILVENFLITVNLKPIIIFEWIHIPKKNIEYLIELLSQKKYKILKIQKDVICFPDNLNLRIY